MADDPGPLVSRKEMVSAGKALTKRIKDLALKHKEKMLTHNQLEWLAASWEVYTDYIEKGKFR